MLILTRRIGETLIIGDDIQITILGIKGSQVRIGINAPKNVSVHREEIYQRIAEEKSVIELNAFMESTESKEEIPQENNDDHDKNDKNDQKDAG